MTKVGSISVLFVALLLRSTFAKGTLHCEDLSVKDCAFAVSSTGARCVLEKSKLPNGKTSAECQTSIIMAERPLEWIETDNCIKSCGLERNSYGLSTDAFMERGFRAKLCSSECQNNCPNVVDLYLKLAAGEGLYLPHICLSQKSKARRLIADPVRFARTVSSSRGRWSQKKISPDSVEAEAFSPISLPKSGLKLSEDEISPAPAPESAKFAIHALELPVLSSPPSPPIPVIPGPLPGVAPTTTERNSGEDTESYFGGEDY
ncbi:hypothetical protein R1sor_023167 [Riccia sorocarpa]|uniref:PAR1 protein n=1 Tax=Riccia sorocarpa TaxID=122646 RepID=A0ABD3GNF5_9MARC